MGCLGLISVGTLKGVGQGCFGWLSSTWLVCSSEKSWVSKKLGNEFRSWGAGLIAELIVRIIYPLFFGLL